MRVGVEKQNFVIDRVAKAGSVQAHISSLCKRRPRTCSSALVFLWLCSLLPAFHLLPLPLLRRITQLFRHFQCYQVRGNLLISHDLTAAVVTAVHLPLPVRTGGQYCQVSKRTVLTLGGLPCERKVWSIDIPSYTTKEVQDMLTGRSHFGVGFYQKVVYVFGGLEGGRPLAACEQLLRNPVQWTALPFLPFTCPYRFSVCLYQGQFYLPVCNQSPFLSIFTPRSLSFRQISLAIPVLQGNSTAFIVHNDLVVVCESRWVARWRLGSEEGFLVGEVPQSVVNFSVESLILQVGKVIYLLKMAYFIKTDWYLQPVAEEKEFPM